MSNTYPFMKSFIPPGKSEIEIVFGFSLSVVSSFSQIQQANSQSLINALWTAGVTGFDLRFVKSTATAQVNVYLCCRVSSLPTGMQPNHFSNYSQSIATHIEQLFKHYHYNLTPLTNETALESALKPFQLQALTEIRRKEDLLLLEMPYQTREVYVTYPWEWSLIYSIPFFEIAAEQQNSCMISIHLEPTRLGPLEKNHLHHATSTDVQEVLLNAGMEGKKVCNIYETFAQRLEQPYLLRICLASNTQNNLNYCANTILRHINSTAEQQIPYDSYQWQAMLRNVCNLEWIPWGNLRDNAPDSARLRYLVDSKGASMVFHIPSFPAKKLKVLLVFASPKHLPALRTGQDVRLILQAIRYGRYRDQIEEPTVLHAATIHDLSRALLDEEFHIVHIAGHGSKTGELILEDEMGHISPVPQEPLAKLFTAYNKTLRCVILSACYSLSQGKLIALGIPFTIAMEGEIQDSAALEFSRGFYDALGAGKEVDFAYEEGCRRVSLAASGKQFVSKLIVMP